MKLRGRAAVIGVVVLLVALGASLAVPEYGEICTNQSCQPEDYIRYDVTSYFLIAFVTWLQAYNGAVVAAATVVIAILTSFLWRIAAKQTELTEILQRPYIAVEIANIRPA